jgi:hypothetical protein
MTEGMEAGPRGTAQDPGPGLISLSQDALAPLPSTTIPPGLTV